MNAKVVVRRGAANDIREARAWYEDQQAGLGVQFLDAIEGTLARIEAGPLHYPTAMKDARRALVQGFPYSVYFRIHAEEIRIVAIFHQHRDPGTSRKKSRNVD